MTTKTAGPPDLSVIICVHTPRRWDQILTGVGCVTQQLTERDELVVVVDHDEELAARLREELSDSRCRVVESTGTRGLSGARNSGVRSTSGAVVVFVDDDAAVRPGSLTAIRERVTGPDVHGVAGAVHPSWEGSAPRWFPVEFGWVVGCDYRGLPDSGSVVRNPIGAAMAIRRESIDAVGGFDDSLGRVGSLPAGCEETLMGIAIRARFVGALTVRDDRFAVDHVVPRDRQTVGYFTRRCFHEGRSKARLGELVGTDSALESERRYVRSTLPQGILRNMVALLRGDAMGAARVAAIVVGLLVTTLGLLSVRTSPRAAGSPAVAGSPVSPVGRRPHVSVVVASIGRHTLRRTVCAILEQSYDDVELIVVDNTPGTGRVPGVLEGIVDARLRIIDEAFPGVSAARNAGIRSATGDIVAFTDDDARPDPGWVAAIVRTFVDDPGGTVLAMTGRVVGIDVVTDEQRWFEEAQIFDKGPDPVVWSITPSRTGRVLGPDATTGVFFPYTCGDIGSGNNVAVRRDALRRMGAFDPALGAGTPTRGGEDLDIFRRILRAGGAIAYVPDAIVGHRHRPGIDELRSQMFGYGSGLSAVLTKAALTTEAPAIARLVPTGLRYLLRPDSARNDRRPVTMPRSLVWIELGGYLSGPIVYGQSRVRSRRQSMEVGKP